MKYNQQEESILSRVKGRNNDHQAEEMRERIYQRTLDKIAVQENLPKIAASTPLSFHDRKIPFYWGVAAAVALLILIPLSFWMGEWHTNRVLTDTWVEVSSPGASISRIVLPDGSKVVMNGRSQIRYPRLFGKNDRQVKLDGEAYFEVEKESKRPFIVQSEELTVEVLGTRFNMKCYKDDPIYKVALNEGSVRVKAYSDQEAITMVPNQEIVFTRDKRTFMRRSINASEDIAWIDGQLNFRSDKLSDILKTVERMFDVTIQIKDPQLASIEYYCQISTNESLEKILSLLSSSGEFKFRKLSASHYEITSASEEIQTVTP